MIWYATSGGSSPAGSSCRGTRLPSSVKSGASGVTVMEGSFVVGRTHSRGLAGCPHRPFRVRADASREAIPLGHVVDGDPLRRRVGLLRRCVASRVRPVRRISGRGRRLLRGLTPVHGCCGHPVAPDDPALRRRLVEQRDPVRRDALVQPQHVRRHAGRTGCDAYDRLVWTPDVLGSICFLVSSYLAYAQVTGGFVRRPRRGRESAIATLNLGGSVAFGIAAIASYWVPTSGSVLDLAAANGFTALGGLCFLAGALLLLPRSEGSSESGDALPQQAL